MALLRLKNIKADSGDLTLAEIARQNRVAPGGVFEALKMVMEPSGGTTTLTGLPKEPPPGLGRRKLSDICEEYGLDLASSYSRQRINAVSVSGPDAETLFQTKRGVALRIRNVDYDKTHRPFAMADTLYHGGKYTMDVVI